MYLKNFHFIAVQKDQAAAAPPTFLKEKQEFKTFAKFSAQRNSTDERM